MGLPFWFEVINWVYRGIYVYIIVLMVWNLFREEDIFKQIGYAAVTVPFLLRVLNLK